MSDPKIGNDPKFVLMINLDNVGKFYIRYAYDFLTVLGYSAGLLAFLYKITSLILHMSESVA